MKLSEQTADEWRTDPRWQLVQRVVASSAFARSSRLSSFLLFVSQHAIQGQTSKLNEQEIGVRIFGRVEGYLQSDDNIVRANASRLRQRLAEYFATEGQFETLQVSLPKGGYVPEFTPMSPPLQAPADPSRGLNPDFDQQPVATTDSVQTQAQQTLFNWKMVSFVALLLIASIVATAICTLYYRRSQETHFDFSTPPSSRLWAALFNSRNPTLVVPADSSLVLYQTMTHQEVSLGQYINGYYRVRPDDGTDDLTTARGLANRRLTSIADLRFVAGILPKLQQTDRKMDVRYARDLQTEDFRQSNVILLGARYANPWVSLLDGERQYALKFDENTRIYTVEDHSRAPSEISMIKFHPGEPQDLAYALVAYVPNFTQGKHALVLEGTSIAATEAAVNFVLDSSEFDALLAKQVLPDGSIRNFELVLESRDFSGTPSTTKVIASRFW